MQEAILRSEDPPALMLFSNVCFQMQLSCSHIEKVSNLPIIKAKFPSWDQLKIILTFGQSKFWPYWELSSNIKMCTHTREVSKNRILWEIFHNKAFPKRERVAHLGIFPPNPVFCEASQRSFLPLILINECYKKRTSKGSHFLVAWQIRSTAKRKK